MTEPKRRWDPYAWVTWLAGYLSGDRHCEWALWFRVHFQYDKRIDASRENALAVWSAEHADMVRARAEALQADGWTVQVEDQNKFNVKGKTATVGGKPDIVAVRGTEVRVEDCKTGRRRESDFWQVVQYLLVSDKVKALAEGRTVSGLLVYRDGERAVPQPDAERARDVVYGRIRKAAEEQAPARTPSLHECRMCDIAGCHDRVLSDDMAPAETEDF